MFGSYSFLTAVVYFSFRLFLVVYKRVASTFWNAVENTPCFSAGVGLPFQGVKSTRGSLLHGTFSDLTKKKVDQFSRVNISFAKRLPT